MAAAAPVQGWANAAGATPMATVSAVAETTDNDAMRCRGGMSHLSWHDVAWTSQLADVTIVTSGVFVTTDTWMGTLPLPCRNRWIGFARGGFQKYWFPGEVIEAGHTTAPPEPMVLENT